MKHLIHTLLWTLMVSAMPFASADTLTSPFSIALTAPTAVTLLGGVSQLQVPSGTFTSDLPNQTLTTPYPVSISGIHLTANYSFQTPTAGPTLNEWVIRSNSISADLVIDRIDANQTITQEQNGSTIEIRLNAVCNNVHLALTPGATQMTATFGVAISGNHATYTLDQFSANWTPSAWQIVSLDCTGPQGFGDLVRQNITAQLQSINPFVPTIQEQIRSQLAGASDTPIVWTATAPGASGVSLSLQPTSVQVQPDGSAIASGTASVAFPKISGTACQQKVSATAPVPATPDSVALPFAALQGLVQCAYLNGSLNTGFTSEQVPAFKSLLGRPLLKFIVWPYLLRYNRNDLFNFNLSLGQNPGFGELASPYANTFQFNLATSMVLAVYSPEADGYEHYVDFIADIDGASTLTLSGGTLNYTQTGINTVTRRYDLAYLAKYWPKRRIWTRLIAHSLRKFMANTGFTYQLPVFQAPGAFSLTLDSANLRGSDVVFNLKIQPAKALAQTSPVKNLP